MSGKAAKAKDEGVKMEVDEEVKNKKKVEVEQSLPDLLRVNLSTLIKAVELDDKNLIKRVWRRNTALRNGLSIYDFQEILGETFPRGGLLNKLFGFVDIAIKGYEVSKSGVGKKAKPAAKKDAKAIKQEPLMEIEAYMTLFIISCLVKQNQLEEALDCCKHMLERFRGVNRQTLDSFVAKTYSYYSLSSEKLNSSMASTGKAKKTKTPATLESGYATHYDEDLLHELLAGHKTSALRLYEQSQATLINLVLRRYIKEKMYSQARMFLNATAETPILDSSNVGNNEQIRFLYYSGKVSAVEASYSESDVSVTRAIRKCPTNTGLGFRLTIHKLNIVTKLLMGEVPERALFYDSEMRKELDPYFHLVKSVRNGSVAEYDKITKAYTAVFERDDVMTLVERLRSSVVKTGLRNINLAYSKIGFKDIMQKLELKSEKDAELVCAKAIRDEIIENAIVDPASKTLLSTETVDVYSTTLEPKDQFNNRINFCLGVHNSALKAHKYPPNSHRPKKEIKKVEEDFDEDDADSLDDLLE